MNRTPCIIPAYEEKKNNGGTRIIGNVPEINKAKQRLLYLLTLSREPFSPYTYCVRNRGIPAAVRALTRLVAARHPILIADIESCFDTVSHAKLIDALENMKFPSDEIEAIKYELTLPYELNGMVFPKEKGLYQGSPMSTMLLDALLYDFDKAVARAHAGYGRYVDDMFFALEDTHVDERGSLKDISSGLEDLGLTLKPGKTRLYLPGEPINYLGYLLLPTEDSGCMVRPSAARTADLIQFLKGAIGVATPRRFIEISILHHIVCDWYGYVKGLEAVTDWSPIAPHLGLFYRTIKRACYAHPKDCPVKRKVLTKIKHSKRITRISPVAILATRTR